MKNLAQLFHRLIGILGTFLLLQVHIALASSPQNLDDAIEFVAGHTSFTIKFSGNYEKLPEVRRLAYKHALSPDQPIDFVALNDSTLSVTFYTFGPTDLFFFLGSQYYIAVLKPNHHSVLSLHFIDSENYIQKFEGPYPDILDNSAIFYVMLSNAMFGDYFYRETASSNSTATAFRDDILWKMDFLTKELSANTDNELLKKFFSNIVSIYVRQSNLLYWYESQMDSYLNYKEEVKRPVPTRDYSYYEKIIGDFLTEPDLFVGGSYFRLMTFMQNDGLFQLPIIEKSSAEEFNQEVHARFSRYFSSEKNIFYDLMLASAYINQIREEKPLTLTQRQEIASAFDNQHIVNYLLYQDELIQKEGLRKLF